MVVDTIRFFEARFQATYRNIINFMYRTVRRDALDKILNNTLPLISAFGAHISVYKLQLQFLSNCIVGHEHNQNEREE